MSYLYFLFTMFFTRDDKKLYLKTTENEYAYNDVIIRHRSKGGTDGCREVLLIEGRTLGTKLPIPVLVSI
jgi:hypothetical protein